MQKHETIGDHRLPDGRIMSLDLGEKRIGVAMSDPTQTIARSYAVINRGSRRDDFVKMAAIVVDEDVKSLLIGLPLQDDGNENALAAWIRDYAHDLCRFLALPYLLIDESYTTQQASDSMRARGKPAKEQRGWVDAVAAAIMLQDYLDTQLT